MSARPASEAGVGAVDFRIFYVCQDVNGNVGSVFRGFALRCALLMPAINLNENQIYRVQPERERERGTVRETLDICVRRMDFVRNTRRCKTAI